MYQHTLDLSVRSSVDIETLQILHWDGPVNIKSIKT